MENITPFIVARDKAAEAGATISLAAARLSIAAIITYHVLMFALIFIRPDIDPNWHTISEYAIGPYGWIMSLAFIMGGISYASLFVAIRSQVNSIGGYIGLGILLLCTLGLFGVGIFTTDNMDVPAETLSTTGILHMATGMTQFLLLPFAALLINLSLARKNPAWRPARTPLLLTAGLPLIGLIAFIVHLSIYVPLGGNAHGVGVPVGWPPRFLFLTYMAWLITLAWQAIRLRNEKGE